MNRKKLRRFDREKALQGRTRGGRKRTLVVPGTFDLRWSLGFVIDAFADGCKFGIPTAIGNFNRECLVLVPDTYLSGARPTPALDASIQIRGMPTTTTNDNGIEMTGPAVAQMVPESTVRLEKRASGRQGSIRSGWKACSTGVIDIGLGGWSNGNLPRLL